MTEPRRPIFHFLWRSDPKAPVDADYHQVRKVRVANRGPIRVVTLSVVTVASVAMIGASLTAALASTVEPLTWIAAAVSATTLVLALRGWVVGTYVTDRGLTVETTFRHRALPWQQVSGVIVVPERAPWLGLPLRVPASRCIVRLADGRAIATHLYTTSPDLWLRPEAWDAAQLRLLHWFERR